MLELNLKVKYFKNIIRNTRKIHKIPSLRIQNKILFIHGKLVANKSVNLADATNALAVIFKEITSIFGLE